VGGGFRRGGSGALHQIKEGREKSVCMPSRFPTRFGRGRRMQVLGCFGLREHKRMSVREGVLLVTPVVILAVLALVYFALSSVAQARSALELQADVHARDAHLHGDFRIRGGRTVVLQNDLVQVRLFRVKRIYTISSTIASITNRRHESHDLLGQLDNHVD